MNRKNKEYWAKRLAEVAQSQYETSSTEMSEKLKKIYDDMSNKMSDEVANIYIKLLEDGINRSDIWTYKRYRDLSKKISAMAAKVGVKEQDTFNSKLEEALMNVYTNTKLPKSSSIGISFDLINETVIKQLLYTPYKGENYSQRIWDNKALMIERLKKGLSESIVLGKSKDKAVEDIIKTCNTSFSNADRLMRTELMHVINEGQRQKYKDSGYTKVEILVADDERTCEHCGSREGTILGIDDGGSYPPFHPRCRCTTIPVIE